MTQMTTTISVSRAKRMQTKATRDIAGPLMQDLGLPPSDSRVDIKEAIRVARNSGGEYRYHTLALDCLVGTFDAVESIAKASQLARGPQPSLHRYRRSLATEGLLAKIRDAQYFSTKAQR